MNTDKFESEKVSDLFKILIMIIVLFAGFWTVFTILINNIGFDINDPIAVFITFLASAVSELAYFKWLAN